MESPAVVAYLDSVLGLCDDPEVVEALKEGDRYRSVERDLLKTFPSTLSEGEGLRLVREVCDGRERDVAARGPERW